MLLYLNGSSLWLVHFLRGQGMCPLRLLLFQDKESVGNLVKLIDKTNGYIFAGIDASAVEFSKIAVRQADWDYYRYPFPISVFLLHLSIFSGAFIILYRETPYWSRWKAFIG